MHTIRAYGGLEIKLHTSLTSALNGGEGFSPPPPTQLLYAWEKSLQYSLNRRLGGLWRRQNQINAFYMLIHPLSLQSPLIYA